MIQSKPERSFCIALFIILLLTSLLTMEVIGIRHFWHENLISNTDETFHTQSAYNLSHGRFLKISIHPDYASEKPEQSIFVVHSMLALPILLFPYLLHPSPLTLAFWHIFFVMFGSIPLFLLSYQKTRDPFFSLAIGIAYLLHVNLVTNALWVHSTTFYVPIILWAFYFREKGYLNLFLILILSTIFLYESLAAYAAAIGLFLCFEKDWKKGVLLMALGTIWFFFSASYLIPHINQGVYYPFAKIIRSTGSPVDLSFIPFLKQFSFLLAPLLFFPIFSPRYMVMALPGILMLMGNQTLFFGGVTSRYATPLLPYLFLATISTFSILRHRTLKIIASLCLIILAVSQHLAFSDQHLFSSYRTTRNYYFSHFDSDSYPSPEAKYFRDHIIPGIPNTASVVSSHFVSLFFSERRYLYIFPHFWNEVDYVIIDLRYSKAWPFNSQSEFNRSIEEVRRSKKLSPVFEGREFLVFQRSEKNRK